MGIVNIAELANQLESDFKNIGIDSIVDKVRNDIKEEIRSKHPYVFK